MTALETIDKASKVTTATSMLELATLKRNMRAMEDVITNEKVVAAWHEAMQHLELTMSHQAKLADSGVITRIM